MARAHSSMTGQGHAGRPPTVHAGSGRTPRCRHWSAVGRWTPSRARPGRRPGPPAKTPAPRQLPLRDHHRPRIPRRPPRTIGAAPDPRQGARRNLVELEEGNQFRPGPPHPPRGHPATGPAPGTPGSKDDRPRATPPHPPGGVRYSSVLNGCPADLSFAKHRTAGNGQLRACCFLSGCVPVFLTSPGSTCSSSGSGSYQSGHSPPARLLLPGGLPDLSRSTGSVTVVSSAATCCASPAANSASVVPRRPRPASNRSCRSVSGRP